MTFSQINYKTLIIIWIIGIPISFFNAWAHWHFDEYFYAGVFLFICMVDCWLVPLFYELMMRDAPRTKIQIGLTFGNL